MRVLKITLATLFVLVICCPLFACGGIGGVLPSTDNENSTYELYLDYNTNKTDTYTFAIKCSESTYTNTDVDFDIVIKNTTIKPRTFKFHNPKLVRESTGAVYSVGSFFGRGFETITLESDLIDQEEFSSTIPTSYKTENYRFEISLNKDKYIFYLYEKPDELREKHTVSYSVNGEIVRTEEVYDKRTFIVNEYEDIKNYRLYKEWFFDEALKESFKESFIIEEDLILYGKGVDVLSFAVYPLSKESDVRGLNFVPSSGEIIIPKTNAGYPVKIIENFAFGSQYKKVFGVRVLYIPKNVAIWQDFVCFPDLETIYYEGTKEEWEKSYKHSLSSSVQIIYNTYK